MLHKERRKPRDTLAEAGLAILAAGNLRQRTLPAARGFRRGNLRRYGLNQAHALFGRHQILTAALYIADLDQPLDDRRPCRRRAESAVLHLFAKGFILYLPAGMLHLPEEGRIVMLLGRLGLFFLRLRRFAGARIALGKRGQVLLVFIRLFTAGCAFRLVLFIDFLPSFARHAFAGGNKAVLPDPRHNAQRIVFMVGIKHRSQPARHHLIELSLVRR